MATASADVECRKQWELGRREPRRAESPSQGDQLPFRTLCLNFTAEGTLAAPGSVQFLYSVPDTHALWKDYGCS